MAAFRVCDGAQHKTLAPRRRQLKYRALWLTLLAISALPARAFAQAEQIPSSSASCLSGATWFRDPKVRVGQVRIAKMAPPSLLKTEGALLQVARQISSDPDLFDFGVNFDPGFLERAPGNIGFNVWADFAVPCDQTQYIGIGLSLNHSDWRSKTDYVAGVGISPFVVQYSCYGNAPAESLLRPKPPELVAEPESKHPPVQEWTLDLPQLWAIAKKHPALFANGVERLRVTTVARLRDADRPQCDQFTVFNWNGGSSLVPSEQKRLPNVESQHTIIELVENGLAIPRPGSTSGNRDCRQGHYLIIDAHSGANIDSGNYLSCITPVA